MTGSISTSRLRRLMIGGTFIASMLAAVATYAFVATTIASEATASARDAWKPTHFVFLDTGPGDRSGTSQEELQKMQADHLGNLGRLAREDKSRLAGPLGRESKKTRGIVILSLGNDADVEREFATDPFMKADFLRVRAYPWKMTTGKLRKPEETTALGEYVTVIVKRDDDAERSAAANAYVALEKQLAGWTLPPADGENESDAKPVKPLALAGAVDGKDDVVGIMIFRIRDIERVRDAIDGSDAFQKPALTYDAFRQYLGAGLID